MLRRPNGNASGLEDLGDELQALVKRRDDLLRALKAEKTSTNPHDVSYVERERVREPDSERDCQSELRAYQMTGSTVALPGDGGIMMCFRTFNRGSQALHWVLFALLLGGSASNVCKLHNRTARYYEQYHVTVRPDRLDRERFVVESTNVPPFIPVTKMSQKFLNKDMNAFVKAIDDYLQAFVSRREQLTHLKRTNGTGMEFTTNHAYDQIECTVPLDTGHRIELSLLYTDPKVARPSTVNVYNIGKGGSDLQDGAVASKYSDFHV